MNRMVSQKCMAFETLFFQHKNICSEIELHLRTKLTI